MAKSNKYNKLELVWAGKEGRSNPEPRILLEQKDKSVNPLEANGNMLIHGDNLLALKSLENEFAGKVKCIYIDPPYNTGNAFKYYNDGFEHSIWLSLMRDRLEILKNLMREDGVIWISIDDHEVSHLKLLCDEVLSKQEVAVRWCAEATKYEQSVGGKAWHYVLIPHDQFFADRSFDRLISDWRVK